MTRPAYILGGAGSLALMVGTLTSWQPALLAVLLAASLAVWGLSKADRINYLLLVVLFLVPVTVDPGYPTEPLWMILLAAIAITLLGRLQRFHPDAPLASPGMIGFALPIACSLSALATWSTPKTLLFSLVPLVCYATIGWYVVDEARRDPEGMKRLGRTIAWIGVPLALLAIYQRISGTWPVLDQLAINKGYTSVPDPSRSAGTMGHPILYGAYSMLTLCVAIALRGRLWQVPFAAGAIGLLLSGSRSSWFGAAAALVIWYLSQERKVTRRGLLLTVSSLAVGGGLFAFGPKPVQDAIDILRSRLTNLTGSTSANARYLRSDAAWSGIWHDPVSVLFGNGPEAHVRYFQTMGVNDGLAQTFDNSFLTLWYDFGIIALLVFAALLVIPLLRFTSLAARMIIIGFGVQIYFFDFYLWPCAAATLILAYGLAVAEAPRATPPPIAYGPPDPSRLALLR